jgi:hypothetical protein
MRSIKISRILRNIDTPQMFSPDDENPSETHDACRCACFVGDIGPATRIFAEGCADRSMGRVWAALS